MNVTLKLQGGHRWRSHRAVSTPCFLAVYFSDGRELFLLTTEQEFFTPFLDCVLAEHQKHANEGSQAVQGACKHGQVDTRHIILMDVAGQDKNHIHRKEEVG
ncbi:unnamed protein product [Heterosigma akashiwo]